MAKEAKKKEKKMKDNTNKKPAIKIRDIFLKMLKLNLKK